MPDRSCNEATALIGDCAPVVALSARPRIDVLVGQRLAALRRLNGLTVSALAAALDIPTQLIADYENGCLRAPADVLIELGIFFRIQLAELFLPDASACPDDDGVPSDQARSWTNL